MKLIFLSILLGAVALRAETHSAERVQTHLPANSRYEIVQSGIAAKFTFRLDKYTGKVWQYVENLTDNSVGWTPMLVMQPEKVETSSLARFQLFESAVAARFDYLLDSMTGRTWILTDYQRPGKSDDIDERWEPIPELQK